MTVAPFADATSWGTRSTPALCGLCSRTALEVASSPPLPSPPFHTHEEEALRPSSQGRGIVRDPGVKRGYLYWTSQVHTEFQHGNYFVIDAIASEYYWCPILSRGHRQGLGAARSSAFDPFLLKQFLQDGTELSEGQRALNDLAVHKERGGGAHAGVGGQGAGCLHPIRRPGVPVAG